ncbi:MAG: DUF169 domain-containing protein [Candidatus Rokuibacteriota bacterium]
MPDWTGIERQLTDALALRRRPVAVAFLPAPPPNVPRFHGREPSGCGFWRLAAEGRTVGTVPQDHANCAIGSYTHNIPLPADRAEELPQTLDLDDPPRLRAAGRGARGSRGSPRRPGAVVYAPLGECPVAPGVILVAGRPGRLMLLYEAAARAGVTPRLPLLGRPSRMALPAALTGGVAMSLGCVGNRVYTGLEEDELYVALPGGALARIAGEVDRIVSANAALAEHHAQRRAELTRD